jgi:hypothetical protein
MISSRLYNENPGHDDRGLCPYSISRCREMHHLRWETSRCGLSMPTPSEVATNTGKLTINCRMR